MKRGRNKRNVLAVILREATGMSQEEAAAKLMVDRSSLSRFESGLATNDEMMYRLITVYGGVPLLDRLIDLLRRARDWYVAYQQFRPPVLYA